MTRRGNREGSIYKHKATGLWCGAVSLGFDPKTGNPVRKYVYGRTRQEVAEKLAKLLRDYHEGLLTTKEKRYLGEWLWTYLELYKKQELRPKTYELYRGILRKHLPEKLARIQLEKLRSEHLQQLYSSLSEKGYTRTVQILHNLIHAALDHAVKLGYTARNVSDATTRPKTEKKSIRVLNREEIERFLSAAKEHRLYPAFVLLLFTGLRRGELLGLEWKDVDLDEGRITVRQNLVAVRGKIVLSKPKTRGSYRTVPLPRIALEALKQWRKKWLEERMSLGPDWPETDLVFPSEIHTPMHPRNFLRAFKSIVAKAGLPQDITIHSLRHTYASILLAQGENPKVVQELLGHSSIMTTMDVYSQVMMGLKEKAARKLDEAFGSRML